MHPQIAKLRLSLNSDAVVVVLVVVLIIFGCSSVEAKPSDEVCDPTADYFLGIEGYPEAISAHVRYLQIHPEDSLAHYHLGFAYGMMGRLADELVEYHKATDLGLRRWDLFLNMGVVHLEQNDLARAIIALQRAVVLGPGHPEPHFNLALAYERTGQLRRARDELLICQQLDPTQLDTRNMLAVIYAKLGDYERARETWTHLSERHPDYLPASENLSILHQAKTAATAQSGSLAQRPPTHRDSKPRSRSQTGSMVIGLRAVGGPEGASRSRKMNKESEKESRQRIAQPCDARLER